MGEVGDATILFYSHFAGKTIHGAPRIDGVIEIISGIGVRSDPPQMGMAKYQDATTVGFLIDDSVRMSMPVTSHSAAIRKEGIANESMLIETFHLSPTPEDLAPLGRSNKAEIRIGTLTKKLSDRVRHSLREQLRMDICAQ